MYHGTIGTKWYSIPWYTCTYHGTDTCTYVVRTYDVALRGVMQALVRILAYMLADIVVAIPAVDLAIEAVV